MPILDQHRPLLFGTKNRVVNFFRSQSVSGKFGFMVANHIVDIDVNDKLIEKVSYFIVNISNLMSLRPS